MFSFVLGRFGLGCIRWFVSFGSWLGFILGLSGWFLLVSSGVGMDVLLNLFLIFFFLYFSVFRALFLLLMAIFNRIEIVY